MHHPTASPNTAAIAFGMIINSWQTFEFFFQQKKSRKKISPGVMSIMLRVYGCVFCSISRVSVERWNVYSMTTTKRGK